LAVMPFDALASPEGNLFNLRIVDVPHELGPCHSAGDIGVNDPNHPTRSFDLDNGRKALKLAMIMALDSS
jgi:hypothetical protein